MGGGTVSALATELIGQIYPHVSKVARREREREKDIGVGDWLEQQ